MIVGTTAVLATAGMYGAFGLRSDERSDVARPALTLLYVGADDCAPCRAWQDGEGAAFQASSEFSHLTYREVKSQSLFDVLKDENWPEDLRGHRDHLGRGAGVPMWLVISGDEIVGRGFGATQWRDSILPKVRSLLR